jgi:hypothetical protein
MAIIFPTDTTAVALASGDLFPIADASDSFNLKEVSWGTIKDSIIDETSPAFGEGIIYDGSKWVNSHPLLNHGFGMWDGYAGKSTDSIYFSNARWSVYNTSTLFDVKNDSTGSIGWTLTSVPTRLIVNICLSIQTTNAAGCTAAIGLTEALALPASASFPSAGGVRIGYASTSSAVGTATVCAACVMDAGDVLTVYSTFTSIAAASLSVNAIRMA